MNLWYDADDPLRPSFTPVDHPPRFLHAHHRPPGPLTPERRSQAVQAALDRDDANLQGVSRLLWVLLLVIPATGLVVLTLVVFGMTAGIR